MGFWGMDKLERLDALAYLRVCPPAEAVAWLRDRPTREDIFGEHIRWDGDDTEIERMLVERDDPYILYGVVRYGRSDKLIHDIWPKLDHPLRIVARLHHPFANVLYPWADPTKINDEEFDELLALARRTGLALPPFNHILGRQGPYGVLDDARYAQVLCELGGHPRFSTPYNPRWLDGGADYMYHKPIQDAWELVFKLEPNQVNAQGLQGLLRKAMKPFRFDAFEAIRRWSIDPKPDTAQTFRLPAHSCYLRLIFGNLIDKVEVLRDAEDLALRWSFYLRFSPANDEDLWAYYDRDGIEFLDYALENPNIWRDERARRVLGRICWKQVEVDRSDMVYHNRFKDAERSWKEKHPEWFVERAWEDETFATPPSPAAPTHEPKRKGLFRWR